MGSSTLVKTRILILSDTHSRDLPYKNPCLELPTHRVDVVIHCGDLTQGATLNEFHSALRLLQTLDSPLKLVIPGNHDFTMDPNAFAARVADSLTPLDPQLVEKVYGAIGEATDLMSSKSNTGITLLEEGTHRFRLDNGAALMVYASPFTPSVGTWGFQYHPDKGHKFDIREHTDIVITHGPPRGILDYTHSRERAGCPHLFTAVANSRPRLHCFGHIHEGWGARLVTWKDEFNEVEEQQQPPTHFTSIDNDKSASIAKLSSFTDSKFDSPDDTVRKMMKRKELTQNQCIMTSHCAHDKLPIHHGTSTLFVNAAICDSNDLPNQKPWIVDLDLPHV